MQEGAGTHDGRRADVRRRILLVDDDASTRMAVEAMIELSDDLEVVGVAADGVAAVERAQQLRPDAIVLDYQMPRMDGMTALPVLLAVEPRPSVVVYTSDASVAARALSLGADDVAVKGQVSVYELLDMIRMVG